jgi:L-lactate utilization protein LutC
MSLLNLSPEKQQEELAEQIRRVLENSGLENTGIFHKAILRAMAHNLIADTIIETKYADEAAGIKREYQEQVASGVMGCMENLADSPEDITNELLQIISTTYVR